MNKLIENWNQKIDFYSTNKKITRNETMLFLLKLQFLNPDLFDKKVTNIPFFLQNKKFKALFAVEYK